jgi:hypothetical protein
MVDADSHRSPRITHISWGRMEVDGLERGKDFKLFPGGGREWDWSETGTHHVPGIQPADVLELIARGSEVLVLSRGMQLMLRTCPETLALLRERGIPVHVEETRAAVALYNRLAEKIPVGGLFHSTC